MLLKALALSALLVGVLPMTATAQERTKLRLSESTSNFSFLQSNLPAIAGIFEEEGFDVEYIKSSAASTGISALINGDVDVYIGSTVALVRAREKGAPVIAVSAVATQITTGIIVSRAWADKNGINEKSTLAEKMAALKGAKIGITGPGAGSDQVVRYSALAAGIDPDRDMELVAMGNQNAVFVAALEQGRIDGFALAPPLINQTVKDQNAMILVNLPGGEVPELDGHLYIVAAVLEDTVKERPDVVVRLNRALQKGFDATRDPQQEPIVREKVRQALFMKMDQDVFEEAWRNNAAAVPQDVVITPEQMRRVIDFENKFLKTPLPYESGSSAYVDEFAKKAVEELKAQ